MKKYLFLAKATLQEYFVYRLNFVLWRFRSFILFLTLVIFWQAVYGESSFLFGYEKSQMMAYVVGIAFLRGLIMGSRSADLAGQIRSGEMTKIVMRPWGVFGYWLSKDAVDKLLNLFFTLFEVTLVMAILKLPFYLPQLPQTYFLFFIYLVLAVFLYFFLSFVISLTTFWTDEIWAVRWIFGVVFLEFMAGAFFPVDVLPRVLTKIIYLTPFPYLLYFPIKVWNEQMIGLEVLRTIMISFIWLVVFYFLAVKLWQKGVKNYGAYGG